MLRLLAATMSLWIVFAAGCGSMKTVFVEEGNPIRMGHDVTGHVYYLDPDTGQWTLTEHPVTVPEGWFAVSPGDAQ